MLTRPGSGSKASTSNALTASLCFSRNKVEKVNAELVTLTYGTIVAQLCTDYENDYAQVNQQLDKMGYNIGMRLIEDFLAKSNAARCGNFRETADMISRVGCTVNVLDVR
jgi:trafficking protein particle complex subunit 3